MLVVAPRCCAALLVLAATSRVRLCAEDDGADLRRAAEVDLGGVGDDGAKALDDLQAGFAKRLEAMGAATEAPPPPPPKQRGAFSVSNAAAGNKAAEEALYRMRRRQTGALEKEHAEAIERAVRAANQWLDAGLPARARAELNEVEKFMTYTSERGADFLCATGSRTLRARTPFFCPVPVGG